MQSATAMNTDVKALLTLWLLKMGTTTQEIQTVLQLAAASRVMVAEEFALPSLLDEPSVPVAANVAPLRPSAEQNAPQDDRRQSSVMHSDIKALLTLALLKVGTSLDDIQTTLRLAAGTRAEAYERTEAPSASEPTQQAVTPTAPTRQPLRAAHLAPISMREYAAA